MDRKGKRLRAREASVGKTANLKCGGMCHGCSFATVHSLKWRGKNRRPQTRRFALRLLQKMG